MNKVKNDIKFLEESVELLWKSKHIKDTDKNNLKRCLKNISLYTLVLFEVVFKAIILIKIL